MKKQVKEFNPEELAKELGLTKQQRNFCDYYVYMYGMNDAESACRDAGYALNTYKEGYSEHKREYYEKLWYQGKAKELLAKPKIVDYIKSLREAISENIVVDRLWIISYLKNIAINGSENAQLKALELLGKTMAMFSDVSKVENSIDDPAKIAREAFEKRKAELQLYKEGANE